MKLPSLIIFIACVALLRARAEEPAAAAAAPANGAPAADPAAAKTKKPAKTNIGDKSFMGDPDPLDVLEPKKQNNLSSENSEPVFEEITDILDEKPKKKAAEKKVEEPALQPPEVVPLDPAPAPDATAQTPNQEPPKPDILTDGFQPPAPEVTPSEPTVVVDAEKPAPVEKKKKEKPKRVDPITKDLISGDDPDFKREERFNRLYKKYNVNPTDEAEWGGASTGRRAMTYEIQRGDTLSDVSATLFGDPKFWPKVWSLNTSITNPHIIVPKQALKFYPGTAEQPPAFNITDGSTPPPAPVTPPADSAAALPADTPMAEGTTDMITEIPANLDTAPLAVDETLKDQEALNSLPPNESKTKVLKHLPPAFQRPLELKKARMNPGVDFSSIINPQNKALNFYIPFQISKHESSAVGQILFGEDGRRTIPDFLECTVQLTQEAQPSDIFYASIKRTEDGFGAGTFIYENVGELEIINVVNSAEKMYRARVRKAIGAVNVGAQIFPGPLPSFNVKDKSAGTNDSVKVKILGAAHDDTSQVIGQNAFIVIDAGSNSGLVVGQEFAVLENQMTRYGEERIQLNERKIGKVHIVQVTEDLATAYVLTSETDIKPGDFIGRLPDSSSIR